MGVYGRTDVLFSYQAGGNLREATFSRGSAATYRNRRGQVSTASSTGVTRLEWYDVDGDGGWEQPGLLIEGSRTNSLTYSEDFSNAAWTKTNLTVSANAGAAPDTSTTGDALYESTVNGNHRVLSGNITISTGQSVSGFVYVKKGTKKRGRLRLSNSGSTIFIDTEFDLDSSTVGANASTNCTRAGGGLETHTAGWKLPWVSGELTGSTTARLALYLETDTGGLSYAGSTTDYMQGWGAQLETNSAFPTSYIPTSSVSVSRSADSLTFPIRFAVQDVTIYGKVTRPLHADVTGDMGIWCDVIRVGNGNPEIEVYFNKSNRTIVSKIADATPTNALASQSIPSGDPIEFAAQFRNITTDPQTRLDVGSGFGSWTSTGAINSWVEFASTNIKLDDPHGGLVMTKVARGLKTITDMRDLRTDHG